MNKSTNDEETENTTNVVSSVTLPVFVSAYMFVCVRVCVYFCMCVTGRGRGIRNENELERGERIHLNGERET